MNFFTVGYVMLMLPLNLSWVSEYAIKILGMLFMTGGIAEITAFRKEFNVLRKPALQTLALCVLCTGAMAAVKYGGAGQTIVSAVSLVCAAASIGSGFLFVRQLLELLEKHNDLVNDVSNMRRVKSGFDKMMIFTALNFLCDGLNRFLGHMVFGSVMGVIMVISKIVMLVYLVSTGLNFNKARNDFNYKHSADFE